MLVVISNGVNVESVPLNFGKIPNLPHARPNGALHRPRNTGETSRFPLPEPPKCLKSGTSPTLS
jgi:hypothetical protein